MPTREEMRSLAEDIVGSYADRVAGIAQIKQAEAERKRTEAQTIAQRESDVGTMLKGFDKEHAAMSHELKADLSKVAPAIKQAEGERKRTETREISQRKSDVSTMLKEFDKEQAAMSQELKADLSKVAPALRESEAERKQTETREISQRKSDVGTMLKEFDKEQAAMSRELRTKLASDEQERHQTTAREISQRKSDVGTMLKEFDKEHAAMSQELRTKLASDEQERHQTTAQEISQRKSDVGTMLREYDKEMAGVRDEWQILNAIMQSKRGGVGIMVRPLVEEIAEEEAAEITPETADIRDRAFQYLANHPDGTRLVELEQEFGLARIKMAKVVKSLMDENKVEKWNMLYFAI